MTVSPLLTVFGFLPGRAAAVSAGNVFFLLGLGFHLVLRRSRTSAPSEVDAIDEDVLEISFLTHSQIFK